VAEICVSQSTMFRRVYKKLNSNEKADVDDAVAEIITNPEVGDLKIGDLAGIYVYKFKCNK
jgi:mRNA interferase RelE/StbE